MREIDSQTLSIKLLHIHAVNICHATNNHREETMKFDIRKSAIAAGLLSISFTQSVLPKNVMKNELRFLHSIFLSVSIENHRFNRPSNVNCDNMCAQCSIYIHAISSACIVSGCFATRDMDSIMCTVKMW